MTNREQLHRAIERMQQERGVLRSKIGLLSQEQLDFRPLRSSWSIGQVGHHVGLAEGVWQSYLSELLRNGAGGGNKTRKVTWREVPFRSRLVPNIVMESSLFQTPISMMLYLAPRPLQSMMFAVPIVRMEASPRMQPEAGLPRSTILDSLDQVRAATLKIVEPSADWDLTNYRIDHPFVGNRDVYGMLDLIASHDQRHNQQIDTIRKSPRFPG
ncbi:MAG: DinB family protein [Acidobacteriota bacterium]